MWLYELNQNNSGPSVFPVSEMKIDGLKLETFCHGPIEPDISQIGVRVLFNITNCFLPPHEKLELKIAGRFTSSFIATFDKENHLVECEFRWHEIEPVSIFVVLDNVTIPGNFSAQFMDPSNFKNVKEIGVEVSDNFTEITLNFSACDGEINNFTATYNNQKSGSFKYNLN